MKKLLTFLLTCILLLTLVSCTQGEQGSQGDKAVSIVTYFTGKAGDNITQAFTSDNALKFSGEGKMWEYYTSSYYQPSTLVIPWHSIASMVESVEIEDGITNICRFAFYGLTNLKHIDISKTITTIGACAFELTGLESLDFLNGLNVDIADYMFKECFWLTKVVIPDGVESIGENAFYKNSEYLYQGAGKIEYVYIPSSVKYISNSAFSGNSNITFIASLESAPKGWQNGWNNGSNNVLWGYIGKEHTYTFEVNGGNTIESIKSDMFIELPTPTKENYYFGGWYDNTEFNGTPVSSPYYSTSNHTLYAKWLTEEEYGDETSFEKAILILDGETKSVVIDTAGERVYFKFVSTETKSYTISSQGGLDTYGYLYNSSTSQIASNDGATDFIITYTFTAGETYYIMARMYSSSATGTFTIKIS